MQLLSSVASLDRGIAAYPSQQKKVDSIVSELEGLGRRPVQLEDRGEGMAALDGAPFSAPIPPSLASPLPARVGIHKARFCPCTGRWRLLYSSAFGSGSLGGRQPGPPAAIVPFSIGQVQCTASPGPQRGPWSPVPQGDLFRAFSNLQSSSHSLDPPLSGPSEAACCPLGRCFKTSTPIT